MSNKRHALADFFAKEVATDSGAGEVEFLVQPNLDFLNIRGSPQRQEFLDVAKRHLGQELPLKPNTFDAGPHTIYWLGPDEWLVVSLNNLRGVHGRMAVDLSKVGGGVSQMGGGFVGIRVGGTAAEAVLRKGCTLDFHPDRFPAGSCAQTGLAKATVLIGRYESQGIFDVIVRRSFADYLAYWFREAAEEFGASFLVK
ncbi:MAG: sarcosine oxidase subunit gamma family protein [Pseudomonadota bacterium]